MRVLERGELGCGASHVAAGMLAPVTEADPGELALLELGLRSAETWPAFAAELAQASGIDPGLRQCGALVVARDRDEAEALERELDLRRELHLGVERLVASAARRVEPALAPTIRLALIVPGDHATDPRATVTALAEAVRRVGVELCTGKAVERIHCEGAKITGVEVAGEGVIAAEHVVVAAGRVERRDRRPAAGSRCARSRARSCACATRTAPACCTGSSASKAATSSRAATAATSSARRWRSAASTRR